tara:strand:- start:3305 stop:5956 length:2652 start_codon:yes stop_codon:yes gene_type:complete
METKVVNLVIKTGDANAAIKKTDKSVKGLKKTTQDVGKSASKNIGGLENSLAALPAPIQRIVSGFKVLRLALISSGIGAFVVAAGGLVALFSAATKKGSEFSKSLSTLKAVSGASNEEMQLLSNSAKELGSTTQFTAVEVAGLQTEYAKLGKTVPEILSATEATLDLAASLEVDLASAATLAGSTVNSFGLLASDTQRVVDVLAKSTSSSSLDFGLLTESLKMAAPIARATGKTIEETAGLLGVLADNGIKGSLAGTGLSKVMSELNKQGLTFEEAYSKVNNSTNRLGTAQKLVGEIGAKSLLNLANSEEAVKKLTTTLEESEGAAKRMAEVRLDNLEGDTTKLSSAWEGFLLSLEDGDGIFTQISRGFVQGLTSIITKLTSMSRTFGAFTSEFEASTSFFKTYGLAWDATMTNFKLGLLGVKKVISQIPIIGKAIDKQKLKEDVANIKATYRKIIDEGIELQKAAAARREEGTFMERVANRIKVAENKIVLEKIEKDEKAAAEKQAKLDEETIAKRKKALEKFMSFRSKLIKRQEDLDDTTEEQKLERQKERDLKELAALNVSSKKKAEAKLLIDQFYVDKFLILKKKQDDAEKLINDAKKEQDRKDKEAQDKIDKKLKEKQKADDIARAKQQSLDLQMLRNTDLENELLELQIEYDRKLELAKGNNELIEALKVEHLEKVSATENDFREKERQAKLQAANDDLDMAASALNSIQSLGNAVFAHKMKNLEKGSKEEEAAARKQFKFNKALQLGMAVIDGGKAITASLAQSPLSIGPVPNPAGIASLAFASITSAAQIAMIAAQKYEAPKKNTTTVSPPSIGGGGQNLTSPTQAPSFNVVGQSGFNQLAGAIGGQPPVQAFVVAGAVTNQQQLTNATINQATF